MKRITTVLISVFLTLSAAKSQDSARISLAYPVYSQYLQNGMMINPAYTGSRGALSAFLSYRMQMMGVDGSPVIQSTSLHTPLKNDHVALGLIAQFMQYGFTRSSSVYASYAYHIRLAKGKLSFGLKGGFDRSNTDFTGIRLANTGDKVFETNDKPYMLPNVSAGVYYWSDKFFAGMAVPSFLSYSRTSRGSVQAYHSFNNYDLMFSAGALISFSDFFKFKPSVLANYSPGGADNLSRLDINGNLILADLIWIGGSWRTTEQVAVGILQVQVNQQLMFGFSYDYPVGNKEFFSKGLNGSSEFILRYEFGSKVSASNPRYF